MLSKADLENGMLDLFLRSFQQGIDTGYLINHILFLSVDQIAFDGCKQLRLHCYRLVTQGVDFLKKQLYTAEEFNKVKWQKISFLRDVLKIGYSFVFTVRDFEISSVTVNNTNSNTVNDYLKTKKINFVPFKILFYWVFLMASKKSHERKLRAEIVKYLPLTDSSSYLIPCVIPKLLKPFFILSI